MATLVFDIETIGEDYATLDETTKAALTRWVDREASSEDERAVMLRDVEDGLGFSPLTGQIVAIGVLDVEKEKGAVYYQAPGQTYAEETVGGIVLKQKTEKEMVEAFWQLAEHYDTFVSFNGRCFDAPYLATRSLVHSVRPTRPLLSNRYISLQRGAVHVDLLDQLSFYGAMRRKGSLHLWCRALGIKSPKAEGVSGDDVAALFAERRFQDIARYNVGDLVATRELYLRWREFGSPS